MTSCFTASSSVPLRECPHLKSSLTHTLFTTRLDLLRFTAAAGLFKSRHMVYKSPDSLPITKSDLRHDNDNTASLCTIPQITVAVVCSPVLESPPASPIARSLLACACEKSVNSSPLQRVRLNPVPSCHRHFHTMSICIGASTERNSRSRSPIAQM